MAQYKTRLHMEVKNAAVWKKLFDLDMTKYGFDGTAEELFSTKEKTLTLNFSCPEKKLKTLIREISKRLSISGILIADSTEADAAPYTYGLYYLGSKMHEIYFDESDERCDMSEKTDISDMVQWLTYGQCEISSSEQQNLAGFKIDLGSNSSYASHLKEFYQNEERT